MGVNDWISNTECRFRFFFPTKLRKVTQRYATARLFVGTQISVAMTTRRRPARRREKESRWHNKLGRRQNMKRTETAMTGVLTIRYCHNVDSNDDEEWNMTSRPVGRPGWTGGHCACGQNDTAQLSAVQRSFLSLEIDAVVVVGSGGGGREPERKRTDRRQRYD